MTHATNADYAYFKQHPIRSRRWFSIPIRACRSLSILAGTALRALVAGISLLLPFASGACVDCEAIRADSRALRDEYASCSPGDSCQVVDLYTLAGSKNCLSAFQCSAAIRGNANLDEFRERARTLVEEHTACNECAMADCRTMEGLEPYCNDASGRCEFRPKE
jgi:hypothetical protein